MEMELGTDMDTLGIPDSLIKMHLTWVNEEEKMNEGEYEKWYKENNEEWKDSFEDFLLERLCDINGSLIPKEEAIFFKNWHTSNIAFGGGYPKEAYCEFEDNGKKYIVVSFSWSSDMEDKNMVPYILAFKEE